MSRFAVPLLLAGCGILSGFAATDPATPAFREAWTSSRLVGTPEPAPPYEAAPVFSGVVFETPVDIVTGPDGARLFVAERWGKIWSFDPREPQPRAELFADLAALHPEFPKLEVYSLAFHPRFADTQEVFIRARMNDATDGARVLRFTVLPGNVPRIDPGTAETVLTFSGAGHNGGNILFGPDKMLYVTAGDAGPATPPDPDETGQAIDDLEASILRVDIDGRDPGLAYRIPGDNPFVGTPGARGEIWAYGLRNPWKIAFRPGTADLWAGDVGWEMWEMIHRIERGGNYGWAITEGPQPVKPHAVAGPTPIIPPVVAHPHTEAASITGGVFYNGTRLPELVGAYIYGDYLTGRIWALWHDGSKVTRRREIARTPHRIVTFGVGGDNELYLAAFGSDQPLLRLIPTPAASIAAEAFPRRLSETGLFVDAARQTPHVGVTPYSVVAPLWQDGATAERWLAMPGNAPAGLRDDRRGPTRPLRPAVRGGSVFARTLSLELEAGKPASRRRIETQLLHFSGRDWHAYTYRWNETQTDADLVGPEGDSALFTVRDPDAPGGQRSLPWRFHSPAECLRCHNDEAGRVLGFIPGNLDVARLHAAGVVTRDYLAGATTAPLAAIDDPQASLELRARSWLHVNCAHCHRFQGGGSGVFRINIEALAGNTLLETAPIQGDFGLDEPRLAAPGAPERSALFYRIAKSGPGHMPQLGASTVDPRALRVLWDWIAGEVPAAPLPSAPHSTSAALRLVNHLDRGGLEPAEREKLISAGLAASSDAIRALFERFLPDDQRTLTLGASIDPQMILALRGDATRGRSVLTKAACLSCHQVGQEGRAFGPDLTAIGLQLTREQLLESLLQPSKTIAPEYTARSFERRDGTAHLGFVIERTSVAVQIRTPTGEIHAVPASEIRNETPLPQSLMPEGLLASLTAQEAADLLALLSSLKPAGAE